MVLVGVVKWYWWEWSNSTGGSGQMVLVGVVTWSGQMIHVLVGVVMYWWEWSHGVVK